MVFSLKKYCEVSEENKFLGIWLDSKLSWSAHCQKLGRVIFLIRCLSQAVSRGVLLQVYYSCFHSLMTYGILAWGHAAGGRDVFRMQRRCVRTIQHRGFRDDCREDLVSLVILTFPCSLILHTLVYARENESSLSTGEMQHPHDTRGKSALVLKYCRLKRSQNSSNYWCAKLYNLVPAEVKVLPVKRYKHLLKTFLAEGGFYSIDEFMSSCHKLQHLVRA